MNAFFLNLTRDGYAGSEGNLQRPNLRSLAYFT
jgi:hypothetical protein